MYMYNTNRTVTLLVSRLVISTGNLVYLSVQEKSEGKRGKVSLNIVLYNECIVTTYSVYTFILGRVDSAGGVPGAGLGNCLGNE